ADFDRDGDLDIAVNHLNGNASLLRNDSPSLGHWVRLELIGTQANRGGVGAVLHLDLGDQTLVRLIATGSSYLSCDDGSLLIGIGKHDKVNSVTIDWPSGRPERWTNLAAGSDYRLV